MLSCGHRVSKISIIKITFLAAAVVIQLQMCIRDSSRTVFLDVLELYAGPQLQELQEIVNSQSGGAPPH